MVRILALVSRVRERAALDYMFRTLKTGLPCILAPGAVALFRPVLMLGLISLIQYPGRKGDVFNVLWVLVFGFATLNILGLVARRFEPNRTRMSFGEMLAVLVVIVSFFLLAWEMLNLLHIFPIKLRPRDVGFGV
jgi:hypothetical protein